MNYKEKYDKAIEALRSLIAEQAIKHCDRVNIKDITNIFSELKESEDERIRKELIQFFSDKDEEDYEGLHPRVEIVAWLEKQGKQNIAVVIPKFRVGDVIRPKGSTAEHIIESISGECYHGKGWGLHLSCDDDYELVEPKPDWSEEDDDNMMLIEDRLSDYLEYIREDATLTKRKKNSLKEEVIEYVNWLKSLKDRYTWKPSEGHI